MGAPISREEYNCRGDGTLDWIQSVASADVWDDEGGCRGVS